MSTSDQVFLETSTGNRFPVSKSDESPLKFGRSKEGYEDLNIRVSRVHLHLWRLASNDTRGILGVRLMGRYLSIERFNNDKREQLKKNDTAFLKDHDKVHLVCDKAALKADDLFSLTVIAPKKAIVRTASSASDQSDFSLHFDDDSDVTIPSPPLKKRRMNDMSSSSALASASNTNPDALSTQTQAKYKALFNNSPFKNSASLASPTKSSGDSDTDVNKLSSPYAAGDSLDGLITDSPKKPIRGTVIMGVDGASLQPILDFESGSNYRSLAFPSDDAPKPADTTDPMSVDDTKPSKAEIDEDDEKQITTDIPMIGTEKESSVVDIASDSVESKGHYCIAIPLLNLKRYHFNSALVLPRIATVFVEFLMIHRHPSIHIFIFGDNATEMQYIESQINENCKPKHRRNRITFVTIDESSDDNGDAADMSLFERILQTLETDNPCRYLVHYTKWNWKSMMASNAIWQSYSPTLQNRSETRYKTAKTGKPYPIDIPNEDSLNAQYNVKFVIQLCPPNHNPKIINYIADETTAFSQLEKSYNDILIAFYRLTKLPDIVNTDIALNVSFRSVPNDSDDDDDSDNDGDIKINNDLPDTQSSTYTQPSASAAAFPTLPTAVSTMSVTGRKTGHYSYEEVPSYIAPPPKLYPTSSGHWTTALQVYVKSQDERHDKWNPCVFYEDKKFVIIYDRYPKAKYHLLVIPRVPCKSIYALNAKDQDDINMIANMVARAQWVISGLKKQMKANKSGKNIDFQMGFHAVPSMNQIHLHIISVDFDSVSLKNKKHWNSFTSDFFIAADFLHKWLTEQFTKYENDKTKAVATLADIDKKFYEKLLKQPLMCHRCNRTLKTIPALKKHISECTKPFRKRTDFEIKFDGNKLTNYF